jgi:uncharacterized protein (DUF1015 family)
MELRPFRCLRFSPSLLSERGLDALIAPPRGENPGAAPENIARISLANGEAAAAMLARWLSEGILMKERRPGLWIYRQTSGGEEQPVILSLLVGLVRVAGSKNGIELPVEAPPPQAREERLAFRRETKADFEPCLLSTRAPLSGALATTRSPDLSASDARGVRHDAFRIIDFAQHVQLQGLVKNAQATLVSGSDLYEAARAFAEDAAAAKLSGARFKLCAIGEESALASAPRVPEMSSGLFAVSLEDPVY